MRCDIFIHTYVHAYIRTYMGKNKFAKIDLEVEPKYWIYPSNSVTLCGSVDIKPYISPEALEGSMVVPRC